MSETEISKPKTLFWKMYYRLSTLLLIGAFAWLFYASIDSYRQGSVIQEYKVENAAQWRLIRENEKKRQELEYELEVTKRLFHILLDQNRISVEKVFPPVERIPPPPEEERKAILENLETYKERHVQEQRILEK